MKRVISSMENKNNSSYNAESSVKELETTCIMIHNVLRAIESMLEKNTYDNADEVKIKDSLENMQRKLNSVSDYYFKVMYSSNI